MLSIPDEWCLLALPYTRHWCRCPESQPDIGCRRRQQGSAPCRSYSPPPGSWARRASRHLEHTANTSLPPAEPAHGERLAWPEPSQNPSRTLSCSRCWQNVNTEKSKLKSIHQRKKTKREIQKKRNDLPTTISVPTLSVSFFFYINMKQCRSRSQRLNWTALLTNEITLALQEFQRPTGSQNLC